MHTSLPSGISTVRFFRLLARAPINSQVLAVARPAASRAAAPACGATDRRPVSDSGFARISSTGAFGDHLSAVFAGARSQVDDPIRRRGWSLHHVPPPARYCPGHAGSSGFPTGGSLSRGCRPIEGSSSTYSTPIRREPIWVARRMRCASPPESVAGGALQGQVIQANIHQETQAGIDLLEDPFGDRPICAC